MPLGNRTVLVAVWRVRVGRVTLYLLDTDLEENAPWDRELSARLYGGDRETRVQQEIILGIGGVRALKAMGIDAVGLSPQRRPRRVRRPAAHPRSLRERRQLRARARGSAAHAPCSRRTRRSRPATTRFRSISWKQHLAGAWGDLGAYRERFLALGHYDNGGGPMFNMTALALRTSGAVNGVSQLHGEVTKQMWQSIWPGVPYEALPVKSITNGVHVPTWISAEIAALFERHLGPDWLDFHDDPAFADRVHEHS